MTPVRAPLPWGRAVKERSVGRDGLVTPADIPANWARSRYRPRRPCESAARAIAALPFLPPVTQWVETASNPPIMDTTRAKQELGWVPRFTAREALRDTLRRSPPPAIRQ
jgi:nucleoside-diphosphate-sugar epimerase